MIVVGLMGAATCPAAIELLNVGDFLADRISGLVASDDSTYNEVRVVVFVRRALGDLVKKRSFNVLLLD